MTTTASADPAMKERRYRLQLLDIEDLRHVAHTAAEDLLERCLTDD